MGVGIVGGIFLAIVFFSLQSKYPYTPKVAVCYTLLLLLVSFGILCAVFPWGTAGLIMVLPTLFTIYTTAASEKAVRDSDLGLMSDEFLFGAISIEMLIVKYMAKALSAAADCVCHSCCCCSCCCRDRQISNNSSIQAATTVNVYRY